MQTKESDFSKFVRTTDKRFDLRRIETAEEDGTADLLGYYVPTEKGITIELKSRPVNKLGKIDMQLKPDQRIFLRWATHFLTSLVVVDLQDERVLILPAVNTLEWHTGTHLTQELESLVKLGGFIVPKNKTHDALAAYITRAV